MRAFMEHDKFKNTIYYIYAKSTLSWYVLYTLLLIYSSSYPSLPWLLTPYLVPETQAQQNYNANHELTRAIGKECISLWKMRFR